METMNVYIQELIAFHYVAKYSSFTKAAHLLGLSKSQLSRQIKALEFYMNGQLFYRTTRSVSLTEEGQGLFHYSERLIELSQETALNMKALFHDMANVIRLTVPGSLGEWMAVPLIKEFRKKYPDLRFEFDFTSQKRSLFEDGYDFALRAFEETDSNLVGHYLGRVKDVICAAPSYLNGRDPVLEPSDLASQDCLLVKLKDTGRWIFFYEGSEVSVEVKGNYAANSYTSLKILCLGGLGIAKLPYYLVKKEIDEGKLIQLCPDSIISTHPLYLVHAKRTHRPIKHTRFKEVLLEWFNQQGQFFLEQERPGSQASGPQSLTVRTDPGQNPSDPKTRQMLHLNLPQFQHQNQGHS